MRTRPFATTRTSALGYGAMYLSLRGRPPQEESLRILHQVISAGVTFIDTADTYGLGPHDLHHNERLIARATASAAKTNPDLLVATKGGMRRTDTGAWEIDGAPDRLYRVIGESFEALGGKQPIGLWQWHWPDPRYRVSAVLKQVRRAQDEKLIRFCGLGNVSLDQIKQARDLVDVVSVQNQFNFWHREAEQDGILEYCEKEDIVFLPWRPMGGLGLAQRLREIKPLAALARERGISPHRLVIAWHLAKSRCMLPIPGSTNLRNVLDCLAAQHVRLEAREMAVLDGITEADLPRRRRRASWERSPPLARRTS